MSRAYSTCSVEVVGLAGLEGAVAVPVAQVALVGLHVLHRHHVTHGEATGIIHTCGIRNRRGVSWSEGWCDYILWARLHTYEGRASIVGNTVLMDKPISLRAVSTSASSSADALFEVEEVLQSQLHLEFVARRDIVAVRECARSRLRPAGATYIGVLLGQYAGAVVRTVDISPVPRFGQIARAQILMRHTAENYGFNRFL